MESIGAVKALAALAQDSRLAVFRMLVQAGPEGLAAGEIAGRLGLRPATASFHLAQLSHAGLLNSRTQGRFVIYSADFPRMTGLLAFLTENCCGGAACDAVPQAVKVVKGKPNKKVSRSSRRL